MSESGHALSAKIDDRCARLTGRSTHGAAGHGGESNRPAVDLVHLPVQRPVVVQHDKHQQPTGALPETGHPKVVKAG